MQSTTPTTYTSAGPSLRPNHPSPPSTPTTPTSFHPSSLSPLEPNYPVQHRPLQNFSHPLVSQSRGSKNGYEAFSWRDPPQAEGGGHIEPLGAGTNNVSYVPPSRGHPGDPPLSPRSSTPEPSEDDDDESSISPRSSTDDDEISKEASVPSSGCMRKRKSGKGDQEEITDDEDMNMEEDSAERHDRGRRRRSTIKASSNFVLEYMPSRSQDRGSEKLLEQDAESLPVIHPDQYSDAETAPSRDHSIGIHNPEKSIKSRIRPPSLNETFPIYHEHGNLETDTTNTDIQSTLDRHMLESLSALHCSSDDEREAWIRRRKRENRQKRFCLGSQKRSIAQSIGSATDEEDLHGDAVSVVGGVGDECGVGVGPSTRRLRRRTVGEGKTRKRGILLFEDPPRRIIEMEEPERNFGGGMGERAIVGAKGMDGEGEDDELAYCSEGDVDMDA